MLPPALESDPPSPPASREAVEAIARLGVGRFANRRQAAPEGVAALEEDAFIRWPACDLWFRYEPAWQRWRGAMRPGSCRYPHPVDGEVCAEFAMLLSADQLWYRDRSLRLSDGGIRGEVDGFSWLLFDRLPATEGLGGDAGPMDREALVAFGLPARAGQMGLWEGRWHYSQTSLFPEAADGPQRIEASGWIEGGRLCFPSDRLSSWAMDVPDAPGTSVLLFESRDGSNLRLQEISQLVDEGRRRFRTTQTLRDGQLLSRTHMEERRTSDDWRNWCPPDTSAADG
jgi:hypothetical protein